VHLSWTEKTSGTIAPDERLPWGGTVVMGAQHVMAMFGATVLAPVLMGFDPNLSIFFSGVGTLIFFAITGGRVPSYLGSSFAFIGPVLAVTAAGGSVAQALGGIVAAGFVYALIGLLVHLSGAGWIDRLMPPLVTGAVVAIIGLNLAGAAKGMAAADPLIAVVTILAVLAVALKTGGLLGRLPILVGAAVGYLATVLIRGTGNEGRTFLGTTGPGLDFSGVAAADWVGLPRFQTPELNWTAVSLIAPVAIVLVAENTGHIKAVSEMTGRNLTPYLGRGFIGDGVATMVAGFGGGAGVTTYAENIGVMAVTRVYSTLIFVVASFVAILLGFSPKFGALIQSIPVGVLGGVTTVLFGLIAATGARIWVDNRVDFSKGANLFIAALVLIVGAADYTLVVAGFALNGIALGTFGAIVLYQMFGRDGRADEFEFVPDDAAARAERRSDPAAPR
jgi:putative pyrimidine permease RutG